MPESLRLLWPDQLVEIIFDLPRRGRRVLAEQEHVALLLQPVAQVGAAQHQRVAVALYQFATLRVHKAGQLGMERNPGRDGPQGENAKQQRTHHNASERNTGFVPAAAPF